MKTSRRDLFKFAAGGAAGLLITPVPWRLVTDTALWSENWPTVPRPRRGPLSVRFTHCALCPAGCAVRARCVGGQPVALAGPAGRPLCAFGLTGHHLPYHPERVKADRENHHSADDAARALAQCGVNDTVAVLDLRPGRTASWMYRRALAALPKGLYLAPKRILPAVNLENARTVLSFGAPLLDGWGTPAHVRAARSHFRLIQAEPVESHTAVLADQWLPVRPGSEEALALALAHLLLPGKTAPAPAGFAELAKHYPPSRAAALTGLPEAQIVALARELEENGPALVLAGEESPTLLALNVVLGSLGKTVVSRRETPAPESWKRAAPVTDLASVPDRSIRALLIDESAAGEYVPWSALQAKLVTDRPLVVTFSASPAGYGRYAQYVLPSAIYPETLEDIPTPLDAPASTFRMAVPLVAPPPGMVDPAQFVGRLAGLETPPPEHALRERADAIHKTGRGTLATDPDGKSVPVRHVTADDFWKALSQGGCWTDSVDANARPPKLEWAGFSDPVAVDEPALPLVAVTCEMRATAPMSPLMSKLYRESNLRPSPGCMALHPETARQCGVENGERAALETRCGRAVIGVVTDSGVPPGIVQVAATPHLVDMCGAGSPARVVPL